MTVRLAVEPRSLRTAGRGLDPYSSFKMMVVEVGMMVEVQMTILGTRMRPALSTAQELAVETCEKGVKAEKTAGKAVLYSLS